MLAREALESLRYKVDFCWLQAHESAAVANCPIIQLVPQMLLDVWSATPRGAQKVDLCHSALLGSLSVMDLSHRSKLLYVAAKFWCSYIESIIIVCK